MPKRSFLLKVFFYFFVLRRFVSSLFFMDKFMYNKLAKIKENVYLSVFKGTFLIKNQLFCEFVNISINL